MELKDCLSVGLQARQSVITQWGVYFALVTFVITNLVLGKDPVLLTLHLKLLGTMAFVLFAGVNMRGLVDGYRLLYAMTEEAKAAVHTTPVKSKNVNTVLAHLDVGDRVVVARVVHGLIGAAVLALIWSDRLRNGARGLERLAGLS